jgi:hypothetical protein
VGEVVLPGLVVSPEYGQQVLTSLRREASVWVKLTSLASWSTLSMVSGAYLTKKRGLRVGEVDLSGLMVSPEYCMVSGAYLTKKRGLRVGEVDLLGLVVSPEYGEQVLNSLRREASVCVKLTSLAS